MANRSFLDIPESDYRGDDVNPNPIEVELLYDDPISKEQQSKYGGTFTAHYYGVNFNGQEYTISASDALHKMIQEEGGTKGSVVRILKKRIGDDNKDIRWSVSIVRGPKDINKIDAAKNGSAQSQSTPAQTQTQAQGSSMSTNGQVKEYVPIRENDEYMKLVRELSKDKIATWNVVYEEVANFYPDEDHEWQATRATHINIDLQKDLYHKWEKERHHVASLPEPLTPREQAVYDSELDTYVETVAQGHENLDKTITGQTMQMFGFKSLPKDKDVWLEIAKIVWRYQDRIDQGMDEYYAVVGTADEFDIPYEIIDMPPNPEEEQEQEEADEIPF